MSRPSSCYNQIHVERCSISPHIGVPAVEVYYPWAVVHGDSECYSIKALPSSLTFVRQRDQLNTGPGEGLDHGSSGLALFLLCALALAAVQNSIICLTICLTSDYFLTEYYFPGSLQWKRSVISRIGCPQFIHHCRAIFWWRFSSLYIQSNSLPNSTPTCQPLLI